MILIADSGSTKTRWAIADGGTDWELATQGLNPRLTDDDTIRHVLSAVSAALPQPASIASVYFYGAGCGAADSQARIQRMLAEAFPSARCHAEGDMLGACRAVCCTDPGLVGILGTGSNLCYFDGHEIALQRLSTGYILGDKGSGNHIGRHLLKDYLEDRMPQDISRLFGEAYPLTPHDFIDRLYRQPYPNRFLASLAPFAARHQAHPYIAQLLRSCFLSFFQELDYYHTYRALPLHLVGGITSSFAPQLRQVAQECQVGLGMLVPDPLPRLREYHLSSLSC